MARCYVCGNDYDEAFEIVMADRTYTFDCFECAIHALASTCDDCGCRIVGHGVDVAGGRYCCMHCAREAGAAATQSARWNAD